MFAASSLGRKTTAAATSAGCSSAPKAGGLATGDLSHLESALDEGIESLRSA